MTLSGTNPAPLPAAIDDGTLRRLAREPARPLFPVLAQAEAMVPLVVVFAFLPALYAVEHRTLSEMGAWEGLLGLRCFIGANFSDLVDPTVLAPANPLRYEPPLASWLTALSMAAFGVSQVAGLVAPAYLCTAGLIVAGYVLGRRLGGEALGLVTAILLAFNPQVLAGAQEPVPQSAGCLFAVLALAGAVAHWQKSSAVMSYQLLLGGIALGLCLLTAGPIAAAIVVIILIYVVWWKLDARFRNHAEIARDRSQFHRRTAFRSTAALAATAFAVGGWNMLLMSSRHGREFWHGWLASGGMGSGRPHGIAPSSWRFDGILELNRLVLPLLALAIVGIFGIVRDVYRAEQDPAAHHRGLLPVWIAVAWIGWIVNGSPAGSPAPRVNVWETLLTIPVVMAAALGVIEIAERRIGFILSLLVGMAALADTVLVAGRSLTHSMPENGSLQLPGQFPGNDLSAAGLVLTMMLTLAGFALARFARGHDARQRTVLTGMLLAIVAANCLWGAVAVRRTNRGDLELEELRSGLARLSHVDRCTFVSLAPSGTPHPSKPPAQLVFSLGSLWPNARMTYARSWEEAAAQTRPQTASEANPDENPVTIFVAWFPRGRLRGAAPAAELKSAAPPFLYRGLEVVAYLRDGVPRVPTAEE